MGWGEYSDVENFLRVRHSDTSGGAGGGGEVPPRAKLLEAVGEVLGLA